VAGSVLQSEVIGTNGPLVQLRLTGSTHAVSDGSWTQGDNDWRPVKPWPRGVQSQLLGDATWDGDEQRFTRFELVAVGVRWGASPFNGRKDDPGPAPFGVVFGLAPADVPSSRVAPAFIDVYAADWVAQP
jgi:hypothetical protein